MKKVFSIMAGLAGAAFMSSAAFADVVCNDEGDCWKVKEKYEYKPELRLHVYGDDWKWADSDKHKYRWRDSGEGRGYYRGGVWVTF